MNAVRALAKIPDPRAFDAMLRLTQDRKLAKEAVLALTVLLKSAASEFDSDLLEAARCLDGIIQEMWEDFSISEGSYDSAGSTRHDHSVDCTYLNRLAETELRRRHA